MRCSASVLSSCSPCAFASCPLLALLSKRRFGVPAGHGLDGGGSAERPAGFGSPGFLLARGQLGQAAFHLGVQRGPAGEAVLAGHRQLGRRQRYPFRDSTDPGQGSWLTVSGCTKQLARLAAKLVEVGAARKLGHDVSSQPRLACGLGKKTILPESITPEQRWTQVLPANPAAPSHADSEKPIAPAPDRPAPRTSTSRTRPGDLEPVSGFEPLTCRLQEACSQLAVRYLHRCHTRMPPLHPKRWDFPLPVPRPVPRTL